jgi:hypothetical protein
MSAEAVADRFRAMVAMSVAVAAGAASWHHVAHVSQRHEAWDSAIYVPVALPALGLLVATLGFVVPGRPWRWAFLPFAGQAAVAFVQNPTANLLPAGLLVFGFFGAVCMVPAYAGAWIRRLITR